MDENEKDPKIDHEHILKRVDDWDKRVHDLIESIIKWTAERPDIVVKMIRKQPMYEGLMKDYNVPVRDIEMADIYKNGKLVFAVKPYGLWTMGANGRIDLLSSKGNYIIVDFAEQFAKPIWMLFLVTDRSHGIPFDKNSLLNILDL